MTCRKPEGYHVPSQRSGKILFASRKSWTCDLALTSPIVDHYATPYDLTTKGLKFYVNVNTDKFGRCVLTLIDNMWML